MTTSGIVDTSPEALLGAYQRDQFVRAHAANTLGLPDTSEALRADPQLADDLALHYDGVRSRHATEVARQVVNLRSAASFFAGLRREAAGVAAIIGATVKRPDTPATDDLARDTALSSTSEPLTTLEPETTHGKEAGELDDRSLDKLNLLQAATAAVALAIRRRFRRPDKDGRAATITQLLHERRKRGQTPYTHTNAGGLLYPGGPLR